MTLGRRLCMLQGVLCGPARLSFCLLIAASSFSCSSGTETGNPSFQAALSYTAYSSAPLTIGVRRADSELEISNVWLDLDTVTLELAGSCGSSLSDALSLPGLGIGDHAAGNHNRTRFALSQSEFCGLDLPFVRAPLENLTGDEPPALAEHSIMLAGSLADGTTFSLLSSATPVMHLIADGGSFEISRGRAQTLIAFDVAEWFAGLDFSTASKRDGAIFVSASENAALLGQFEANLARGIALYRDADGDGKLDAAPERLAHAE